MAHNFPDSDGKISTCTICGLRRHKSGGYVHYRAVNRKVSADYPCIPESKESSVIEIDYKKLDTSKVLNKGSALEEAVVIMCLQLDGTGKRQALNFLHCIQNLSSDGRL